MGFAQKPSGFSFESGEVTTKTALHTATAPTVRAAVKN